MKEELDELYKKWSAQVPEKFRELKYSNPYYVGIPDGWETAEQRIMIVGEEGYGTWGCGKAYGKTEAERPWEFDKIDGRKEIQKYNIEGQKEYLTNKNTGFWRRFKQVKELGYPCIWNNLDKIHLLKKRNCALSTKDEILLHSTEIKILQEEIKILKPTTVIFFGWHKNSLKEEWSEMYVELYANKKEWRKSKLFSIHRDSRTYIFSYHPGRTSAVYENQVIEFIKEHLK